MRAIHGFALAVCLAAGTAHAATLFKDNFKTGAKADWGNEAGQWRAVAGTYDAGVPGNGNANPVTYSSVSTHPALTDFTVKAKVIGLNDGGIWLRSAYNGGKINGVLLVTGGNNGTYNGFYWHIVQNGSFSGQLNAAPYTGAQGATLNLRVTVTGNTYALYVGNATTPLTSVTTDAFQSGAVGLYDYSPNSGASTPRGQTWDNVVITGKKGQ